MNETKLRAALIEARDWFESQAKDASKGCGPSYELHDLRVQRDALDAALATPAQAAALVTPSYDGFMAAVNEMDGLYAAPLAITSAPERIWLDLGVNPCEEDAHFSNLHDLTWSQDNATGDGIEYVRADLAAGGAAQAAPIAPVRQPLTIAQIKQIVITVCDSIYPQGNASYSEEDSVFYGAFARAIEAEHGIK